jgi:hypothetical protein
MNRIIVSVCALLTLGIGAWASGKSYDVTLHQTITSGGVELQPGEYKLNVENEKATFHQHKLAAENPVRVETAEEKYRSTSMILVKGDGKYRIREIHLGGTNTRLVFTDTQP